MPLLNIDPDKLFKQSSILEIEDIQKKLQTEIEKKREELRTMVGERYRDLIEAADTISQMKLLSEKVIDDVNKMKAATSELQKRQIYCFDAEYSQNKYLKNNVWGSVAAQIKILVDIPEYIWEAVDQSDFTRATLLFLMARYIKTSLEINPNFKMDTYFSVVLRQWSFIAHFKDTILQGAEEMLKSQHVSQAICGGLLSLALLENLSAEQLLERYLSLRSAALRSVLSAHQSLDSAIIKERLCESYTMIIHSIIGISHCFLEDLQAKEGLLWKELHSHVSSQSLPTLHLLEEETTDIPTSLLPSAIKEFRPVLDCRFEPLSESYIYEAISTWLVWVRQFVKELGGQLLQRLSSLSSLKGLRDAPVVMHEEWAFFAQKRLLLPSADLWTELYRPLLTVRAQQIVSVHWKAALKTLQQQLRSAFQMESNENKQTEVDLLWYIWKECAADIKHINDRKSTKGLWLKSKGITPRVAELCTALEHKICSLLGDLNSLCPEQEVDPALLTISLTLKAHQQTVCSNLIERFVQFIKKLLEEATSEAGVLLLAKFLQSMPELCPSLSKSLSSVDSKSVSWQESHAIMQAECLEAYNTWQAMASKRVIKHVIDVLGSAVPNLHSIPQWEEISIEEEGEPGKKLQSILKVPCSVSLNLQSSLHHLASVIGHVIIPKQITEQFVHNVIISIIDIYNTTINNNMTQTQYLQMLLDVKYLSQLFNSSSNKVLKPHCQDTISNFESKIDPFDLNVFTPYINDNVKKNLHRTQTLMAIMGTAATTAVPSPHSEEPSVLALSTSATMWFPLLHITVPRVTHSVTKTRGQKSTSSPSVGNISTDPGIKQSSAASFFGVMATDWFG